MKVDMLRAKSEVNLPVLVRERDVSDEERDQEEAGSLTGVHEKGRRWLDRSEREGEAERRGLYCGEHGSRKQGEVGDMSSLFYVVSLRMFGPRGVSNYLQSEGASWSAFGTSTLRDVSGRCASRSK